MKAANVRLGFATNSSSSHSIVLQGGERKIEGIGSVHSDFEFGWESFSLDEAGEKAAYLVAGVQHSLRDFPDWQVRGIVSELFAGTNIPDAYKKSFNDYGPYGIDHQSAFSLPNPNSEHFPALVKEALEFFCDRRLVVYGGNDNDDSGWVGDHKIAYDDYDPIRFRRDGDNYVLFNWRTGAKTRIVPNDEDYDKATSPELVDLKITDFCPYGCAFCYQGSTKEGIEPDFYSQIKPVIEAIGINGLGAFEVAIGGGEPTTHTNFCSIIDLCVDNYLKPNFTTFAVDWLLDERKIAAANKCGGIGVSVHNIKDIGKVKKIDEALSSAHVMAQHVYGTLSPKKTAEMMYECKENNIDLLLLGYKTTGFGSTVEPHDMRPITDGRTLPKYYLSNSKSSLSVDTAMVQNHPELIEYLDANEALYSKREGAFSMYVDATKMAFGPSSYCLPDQMIPFKNNGSRRWVSDDLYSQIRSGFAGF